MLQNSLEGSLLTLDKDITALVKQRTRPTLDQVVELARKYEIKDVHPFWALFDSIRKKWLEARQPD